MVTTDGSIGDAHRGIGVQWGPLNLHVSTFLELRPLFNFFSCYTSRSVYIISVLIHKFLECIQYVFYLQVMIGIIGGSGMSNPEILKNGKEVSLDTPYGKVYDACSYNSRIPG